MKFSTSEKHFILIAVVTILIYFNANFCGFVFDDVSAIKDNKDLRSTSPWLDILKNDFWGTPISKEHSHKSYRPVCVFSFKLNYLLHGLEPFGYHLVNVVLHSVVCLLYYRFLTSVVASEVTALISALLFAAHPIHTEAVTGVVGRAELLSSIFFLLGLMIYQAATKCQSFSQRCLLYFSILLVTALATFSKEQGITVLGLCFVYEVFFTQKLHLEIWQRVLSTRPQNNNVKLSSAHSTVTWLKFVERSAVLVAVGVALIVVRLQVVMGSSLPVFTNFDNPAAHEGTPVRQFTWSYLVVKNFFLLLCPTQLCCDWTMGSIPLVRSLADPRNLATLFFVVGFVNIFIGALLRKGGEITLMAVAMMAIPFLPASNLFFPVGFVIAERVLYIPSMGFCLLVAIGFEKVQNLGAKKLSNAFLIFLFCVLGLKTIRRNFDWTDESTIFMSGLRVNPENAKLWNNVGHALEGEGRFDEALRYFQKAAQVQPDDVGAHINVGRTLNSLGHLDEAEKAYLVAKSLLPQPKKGQRYTARIAPQHLSVFLNLGNLVARDPGRLEEADLLYRQAISMRADYTQAYINRGDVLIKMGHPEAAKSVYETALSYDSLNADIHYNIGVVHIELGKSDEALRDFDRAIQIDSDHVQSLLNSAILMQSMGLPELRPVAYKRLFRVLEISKDVHADRVYFNLGMLGMDDGDVANAELWFKKSIEFKPNFRSALFNLALLLNEQRRPLEALPFLQDLLSFYPDHVKGLILMGDIYTNHVKDLKSAERCYKQIIQVDPNHVQGRHNLCVVLVEQGHLLQARDCLVKVQDLAPNEEYIKRHLQIVENRIKVSGAATTSSVNES